MRSEICVTEWKYVDQHSRVSHRNVSLHSHVSFEDYDYESLTSSPCSVVVSAASEPVMTADVTDELYEGVGVDEAMLASVHEHEGSCKPSASSYAPDLAHGERLSASEPKA